MRVTWTGALFAVGSILLILAGVLRGIDTESGWPFAFALVGAWVLYTALRRAARAARSARAAQGNESDASRPYL